MTIDLTNPAHVLILLVLWAGSNFCEYVRTSAKFEEESKEYSKILFVAFILGLYSLSIITALIGIPICLVWLIVRAL